jgi:hypothetical protein
VLPNATFMSFASSYLNVHATMEIVPKIEPTFRMLATRITPAQQLIVTWGHNNFYADYAGGTMTGYGRITAGGRTALTIMKDGGKDGGMRLFPKQSCVLDGIRQFDNPTNLKSILPFPREWTNLFGTAFLPIYQEFDLHNSALLQQVNEPASGLDCVDLRPSAETPADSKQEHPATKPPIAPTVDLFLFSPLKYVKAEPAPRINTKTLAVSDNPSVEVVAVNEKAVTGRAVDMAQFENDTALKVHVNDDIGDQRNQVGILARQFWIVGCIVPGKDKAEGDAGKRAQDALTFEWNQLLTAADAASKKKPAPPVTERPCGSFVHGVFAGKSFVELRNHYSINGRPVESGADLHETIGQALAGTLAAHLNQVSLPHSKPLVEVLRSPYSVESRQYSQAIRLRFYTTNRQQLDQAYIFEGDEIYAGGIP